MRRLRELPGLVALSLLAGCGLVPSPTPEPSLTPEYRPEVVGVVVGSEFLADRRIRVDLSGGRELVVDRANGRALLDSQPDAGDLLFYGTDPEPWFYALRIDGSESCGLNGLATQANGELHFDFGLVLPLAPDFHAGSGNYRRPGGSFFCVNARGQVTRLYE